MRYTVHFDDTEHGEIHEQFMTFDEAAEYWQSYADTPTCVRGMLYDEVEHEVIWAFTPEDEACE